MLLPHGLFVAIVDGERFELYRNADDEIAIFLPKWNPRSSKSTTMGAGRRGLVGSCRANEGTPAWFRRAQAAGLSRGRGQARRSAPLGRKSAIQAGSGVRQSRQRASLRRRCRR